MKLLVITLSLVVYASPYISAAEIPPRPPNVVFILADDLGWMDLGCQGSTLYQTPHIDRLAAHGVRFTNAYAACCVCSPSRASLMTGQYPARLHLTDYLNPNGEHARPTEKLATVQIERHLPSDTVSLGQAFKNAGYVTCFVGKWHLGSEREYWPDHFGFDLDIGGCGMGHPNSYFSPYKNPALTDGPVGEYLTDRLTDEADKFIETNKDKPFLLYLAHYAVHNPQQAKADMVTQWKAKISALSPPTGPEFLPVAPDNPHTARQRQDAPVYSAMVQSLDEGVGHVLDKLDELGLAQNTIVVFFSDNGGLSTAEGSPTSNVPLRGGKGWPYEGGVREPMIVLWPGVTKAGTICETPMISTDFYPTLLDIAGLPPEPKQTLDGVSIVPLLKGQSMPERPLFWHYPHYGDQGGAPNGAIRVGDFKLIQWYEDMHVELYNLKNDLGEKHDLAVALPDKAKELLAQLDQWRTSVGAVMPLRNPEYDPSKVQKKKVTMDQKPASDPDD